MVYQLKVLGSLIHELMGMSFPQATDCYDKILQFRSIKHYLDHSLAPSSKTKAVRKIHRSANLFYLFVISGHINMISNKVNSTAGADANRKSLRGS
jgi:hypothetical protein